MKKIIILFLVILVGVSNTTAQVPNSSQSEDLKVQINSLSTMLGTLQHDYDYLYCNYMLSEMQFNLKDYMNELSIKANEILIYCYSGSRFNIDLYLSYKDNYDVCKELYDSFKSKTETVITAVELKMITSNFRNDEIQLLDKNCKFVYDCLSAAQYSLNHYKFVLDTYRSLK